MYLQKYSKLLPTVFLLIFLVACGLYLFVTGASVMWSGFIAMMFFYALIFYFGSYVAGNQKVKDGNERVLPSAVYTLCKKFNILNRDELRKFNSWNSFILRNHAKVKTGNIKTIIE